MEVCPEEEDTSDQLELLSENCHLEMVPVCPVSDKVDEFVPEQTEEGPEILPPWVTELH
jgi:hypothetical protein